MDSPAYHYEMTLLLIKEYIKGTSVDDYLRQLQMTENEITFLKTKLSNRYTNFALIANKKPGEVTRDEIAQRVPLVEYQLYEIRLELEKRYAFCTMPSPPYKYEAEGVLSSIFQYTNKTKLHFETHDGVLKINPLELIYIEEI